MSVNLNAGPNAPAPFIQPGQAPPANSAAATVQPFQAADPAGQPLQITGPVGKYTQPGGPRPGFPNG